METDAQFLLRVLADGRPHTLNEIIQASFAERGCGLTVHSRASDLRSLGHTIVHETIKGAERGAGHTYRLIEPEDKQEACAGQVTSAAPALTSAELRSSEALGQAVVGLAAERNTGALPPIYACSVDESAGQAEQLALTDSAAAHIYRDLANTPL